MLNKSKPGLPKGITAPLASSPNKNVRVLQALRRIVRAIELHSKKLANTYRITAPQLVCLIKLKEDGPLPITALSRLVHLSPSTLVGVMDRLEEKALVKRTRSSRDRRVVHISITEKGKHLVAEAPSPLQDKLAQALDQLPELEHLSITFALEKIVDLMEAGHIEGEPVLKTGPVHQLSDEPDPAAEQ
jgi:DNA-binding MarR family transcriptional regulator